MPDTLAAASGAAPADRCTLVTPIVGVASFASGTFGPLFAYVNDLVPVGAIGVDVAKELSADTAMVAPKPPVGGRLLLSTSVVVTTIDAVPATRAIVLIGNV